MPPRRGKKASPKVKKAKASSLPPTGPGSIPPSSITNTPVEIKNTTNQTRSLAKLQTQRKTAYTDYCNAHNLLVETYNEFKAHKCAHPDAYNDKDNFPDIANIVKNGIIPLSLLTDDVDFVSKTCVPVLNFDNDKPSSPQNFNDDKAERTARASSSQELPLKRVRLAPGTANFNNDKAKQRTARASSSQELPLKKVRLVPGTGNLASHPSVLSIPSSNDTVFEVPSGDSPRDEEIRQLQKRVKDLEKKAEDERKKAEDERKKAEDERKKAEDERKKAEAEKKDLNKAHDLKMALNNHETSRKAHLQLLNRLDTTILYDKFILEEDFQKVENDLQEADVAIYNNKKKKTLSTHLETLSKPFETLDFSDESIQTFIRECKIPLKKDSLDEILKLLNADEDVKREWCRLRVKSLDSSKPESTVELKFRLSQFIETRNKNDSSSFSSCVLKFICSISDKSLCNSSEDALSIAMNSLAEILVELGMASKELPLACSRNMAASNATKLETPYGKKSGQSVPIAGRMRFDIIFFHTGSRVVVLIAEQETKHAKKHAFDQLANAERLVYTSYNFGSAPYVLVWIVSGSMYKLYKLSPPKWISGGKQENVLELVVELDLTKPINRLFCVLYTIWVFKHTSTMVRDHYPTERIPKHGVVAVPRNNPRPPKKGTKMTAEDIEYWTQYNAYTERFLDARMMKNLEFVPNIAKLKELYQAIDTVSSPYLLRGSIRGVGVEINRYVLESYPIGYNAPPRTKEERDLFLSNVVDALKTLHKLNWFHRDVRSPNIVRRGRVLIKSKACFDPITGVVDKFEDPPGDGFIHPDGFMVVDYEMAAHRNDKDDLWPVDLAKAFQLERRGNERWTEEHDFAQFYKLVVHQWSLAARRESKVETYAKFVAKYKIEHCIDEYKTCTAWLRKRNSKNDV